MKKPFQFLGRTAKWYLNWKSKILDSASLGPSRSSIQV